MLLGLLAAHAHAGTEVGTSRKFGLGLQLGQPTGITGKFYLSDKNAIDFLVGEGYPNGGPYWNGVWAHVDYNYKIDTLASGDGVTIPFRLGVGGFLSTGYYYHWVGPSDAVLGARMPVGLDFDLEQAPVQFYVEAALELVVYPGIYIGFDVGIGARYYF